jgi:hypothetical protein
MHVSNAPARPTASGPARRPLFPAGQLVPFFLVTALFYLWGIPNNLNDVLIRQFMKSFAITRFQAGLVQSAFYMGYFVLAMPAALIMRKLGYKAGFVIGLLLCGHVAVLAGRVGRTLWVFPARPFCHRQRTIVSRNRLQPLHRAAGRPGEFGEAAQLLASVQSPRLDYRCTDRHSVHFFGCGIEFPASGFDESPSISTTRTCARRRCAWLSPIWRWARLPYSGRC